MQGIYRVAGSLVVTRALGDAYLKRAALSIPPYAAGVPYITGMPQVCMFELAGALQPLLLVLASDGVWETLSNAEVAAAALDIPDPRAVQSALHNFGTRSTNGTVAGTYVPCPPSAPLLGDPARLSWRAKVAQAEVRRIMFSVFGMNFSVHA